MSTVLLALGTVVLLWALGGELLRRRCPVGHWYIAGYPAAALRVWSTWRRVALLNDLAVNRRPPRALLGGLVVIGDALRPVVPRASLPRATRLGLTVTVRMCPGQTPAVYRAAAEAFTHAWKVHAVRVTSPERGMVRIAALASDPLTSPGLAMAPKALLSALVGIGESGGAWVIDLLEVPHWLVTGATRSGKSTLLARLIAELSPQDVALVGIDCKGGMELGPFAPRLSALATSRREAVALLGGLLIELHQRMRLCRGHDTRSIWELSPKLRPVPVVIVVDEVAELYLSDGTRAGRAESEQCSAMLLRLVQLGGALGLHLVVAGQRVGSDLGPGVTALRAQLGGRICHRVHDSGTAEMTLGDLDKDAVAAAQSITPEEPGVAIRTGPDGGWERARSHRLTPEETAGTVARHASRTPHLPTLEITLAGMREGEEE
ncbi:FtsK/SpoIIIE domain-containing protein [Streptomyces jumonjinensis]|uniref:Cell division protein FtsK n=1 Tax=Streptomyces jumonjinensis TaxID=1945 RepID=A0A646KEQ9_STRJU|nr:FtsK/SpoIIIE domain-containing protein [Streptomyces jumonjinensis]MQT00723.1 cell division protein FtsK [Streptomyces jumonjinensis]